MCLFIMISGWHVKQLGDTVGQAFGAKEYNLLGIYKQRAIVVLTLVSSVVAAIWMYTGQILCSLDRTWKSQWRQGATSGG